MRQAKKKKQANKTSKSLSFDSLPTNTLRAFKTVSFGIGVGGSYGRKTVQTQKSKTYKKLATD